ncbi:lysylphosphatidylglycerol synthase transmembrane domain-containing protein [Salinilacihabitans rarus]|uniref:lysylphosphatidylglycerol synthase transmembrane domain-containing protein n=1 Tax=Salinilacihabitans rarus TaxID=2961596 RepID=UPI0020C8949F|nr:lysylphosphatidylglycerol synthase transmembrane domain-containing protein [Salinilacihabitans rarus]
MIAGFAGALIVLAVLLWLVGVGEVVATLRRADVDVLALVALAALGWLLAWSLALRTVLAILGIDVSVRQATAVFAATVFANNVTPFGQAGGEPVSALLISSVADTEYETGLATIVSLDALKLLPPIGFGLLGIAYYATTITLSERLETAAVALCALAVGLPAVGLALWRRRDGVASGTARGLAAVLGGLGRVIPRWRPPTAAALERRARGFVGALERVAGEPRAVAFALAYVSLGWLGLIASLWLSLAALGFGDPRLLAAAFVAVPLGSVASATPFPGALGGMEAALVVLLTPITGLPASAVGAAVLCHRFATYWLPTLLGGAAAFAFGSTARW